MKLLSYNNTNPPLDTFSVLYVYHAMPFLLPSELVDGTLRQINLPQAVQTVTISPILCQILKD
jgi:hypothetical protein